MLGATCLNGRDAAAAYCVGGITKNRGTLVTVGLENTYRFKADVVRIAANVFLLNGNKARSKQLTRL